MSASLEIVIPYVVSNALAVGLLVAARARPPLARWAFVALFGAAAIANADLAIARPALYLGFADVAFEPFARMIRGWSAYVRPVVLAIAVGQAAIAVLLAADGWRLRAGVLGAIVFFVAIAPLGIGSAFPCSLVAAAAVALMAARIDAAPVALSWRLS